MFQMIFEICQRLLDGFGMSVEWALSIVIPIVKGKGLSGTAAVIEMWSFFSMVVKWVL